MLAIGLLTKLNFLGVVPGATVALIVLARRRARTSKRAAYLSLALAIAIPAGTIGLYSAISLLSAQPELGLLSGGLGGTSRHGSVTREIVYIWQLYLPRLPGMPNDFPGIFPTRQIWFDRLIGAYGWLDTYFPNWVYDVALVPAGAIALLCVRALVASRTALRARAGEACLLRPHRRWRHGPGRSLLLPVLPSLEPAASRSRATCSRCRRSSLPCSHWRHVVPAGAGRRPPAPSSCC